MTTRPERAPTIALVLLILFVLLAPDAALAHARLTRSEPAARARLADAPREIVLWFTLPPEPAFTRVTLLRDGAIPIPVAVAARVPGAPLGVRLTIVGAVTPGTYTVSWQSAVSDGHPLRGRYTFVVLGDPSGVASAAAPTLEAPAISDDPHAGHGAPAAPAAPDPRADVPRPAGPPALPADLIERSPGDAEPVSWTGVALRSLGFGALLAIVGAVVFRRLVLRSAGHALLNDFAVATSASARAAGVGLAASALVLAAAVGRLAQQARALPPPGGTLEGIVDVLAGSRWGLGWLLQVAAALVALVAFAHARTPRRERSGWTLAAVAAAALVFTPALTGHAAAMDGLAPLAIATDGLHVIGAGGWIGTLLVIALAGLPAAGLAGTRRGAAVAAMVNAFSPMALAFAALAALTGVTSAALHLASVSALWSTPYGRTLLLKLGLVLVVMAIGAWNWKRVRPGLPDGAAADRLEKSALLELVAAAGVVVVTAILTGTAP